MAKTRKFSPSMPFPSVASRACRRTTNVGNDIADPDGILVRSHVMHEMPIPESVLAIGRAGAGTNNIP